MRSRFAALPFGESPLLLVGPPGAGKTLTVARLATRLVMAGIAPMVITADGKRAGATEQLAAFTRLLGISLHRRQPSGHPRPRPDPSPDGAPVLIDTPGCDPFDPAQMEELTGARRDRRAAMVLVLPAGLDPAEAADLAQAFAASGARLLVATRLDLARRLGGMLAAAGSGLRWPRPASAPARRTDCCRSPPRWLAARLLDGMCPP